MSGAEAPAAHPLSACPACRSTSTEAVWLGQHELRRCTGCGLVHAREAAAPELLYVDGYLTGATDFGFNTVDPHFQRFLVHCGHRRLAAVERHAAVGSFLDVGCGTGDAVVAAAERGWDAIGVEPVEESATLAGARGIDVRCATLEASGLPESSFDVVGAHHVLEHMEDGLSFLRLLARWARPGGLVVVEVPNWDSWHRRRKGEAWPGLRPLEHVAHYGADALGAALDRAGLEVVEVRSLGFLWDEQTVGQALDDLARPEWARPLTVLGRVAPDDRLDRRRPVAAALRAAQRAYDRKRRGQVLTGIARRPAS